MTKVDIMVLSTFCVAALAVSFALIALLFSFGCNA